MNKLLALTLSLPLVACVVGSGASSGDDGTGDDGGPGGGDGGGGGNGGNADHITSNTTWTGTVDVAKTKVVDPGVTLTIAAGTTVRFASGASGGAQITVQGKVDVQGQKGNLVHLSPATAGQFHGGFSVVSGGELTMNFAVEVGGPINTSGTAKVTITDSQMSQTYHDLLVVDGGTINMTYSQIGLDPGAGDTTHCDMHFGGTASTITITNSNLSTSTYGLMLYGGTGVNLKHNNWFGNTYDIDTSPGVMGDVREGWFEKGSPVAGTGAMLITDTVPVPSRLADAGPRFQ